MAQVTRDALSQIGAISGRIALIYADRSPERAELFLRRALEAKGKYLTREDIKLFNQLCISLRQQGKWQSAIEEYRKALKVAPDDENLFYNMGMAYAEGKMFREARQSMVQALRINGGCPMFRPVSPIISAWCFSSPGARDQARSCLEVALELKPDMEVAKAALAKLK